MKKLIVLASIILLLFVFVTNVEATPPAGLKVEFCKQGLFPRLFGNCFEWELLHSYSRSSIQCRSLVYSSAEPTMDSGWRCEDSMGRNFTIPYSGVTIENLNSINIEIIRSDLRTGFPRQETYSVDPSEKSIMMFDEKDTSFSISFDYH